MNVPLLGYLMWHLYLICSSEVVVLGGCESNSVNRIQFDMSQKMVKKVFYSSKKEYVEKCCEITTEKIKGTITLCLYM